MSTFEYFPRKWPMTQVRKYSKILMSSPPPPPPYLHKIAPTWYKQSQGDRYNHRQQNNNNIIIFFFFRKIWRIDANGEDHTTYVIHSIHGV